MSWLDLNNRENYESVLDYVTLGREGQENGRKVNHHRLKPGTQQKGKTGPSGKEEPQIVPLGNLRKGLEDLLKTGDCAAFVQKLINKANSLFIEEGHTQPVFGTPSAEFRMPVGVSWIVRRQTEAL